MRRPMPSDSSSRLSSPAAKPTDRILFERRVEIVEARLKTTVFRATGRRTTDGHLSREAVAAARDERSRLRGPSEREPVGDANEVQSVCPRSSLKLEPG